jgi:hypothetical protein
MCVEIWRWNMYNIFNVFALLVFDHVTFGYVGHSVHSCNLGNVEVSKMMGFAIFIT